MRSLSSFPEILEPRIAPAVLVDARNVTFRDLDGDKVTISSDLPIFDQATVNAMLAFSAGSVDGTTSTKQALWKVELDAVATVGAAMGLDLTIVAEGKGTVNVGFIKAETLDLGAVTVDGDLGRIVVGDATTSTRGLESLTVVSMGQVGLKSQAAGGDLISIFRGGVNVVEVAKNVTAATLIALGDETVLDGGLDGSFGQVYIGGSLVGGSTQYAGSLMATGPIDSVEIHGGLTGSTGPHSGYIGYVPGPVLGLPAIFISGGPVGSVTIGGTVRGGPGPDSGRVATTSVESIVVGGDVQGGNGERSGYLYASGGMGAVQIGGDLIGNSGTGSGRVENNDLDLGKVFIGGDVKGGSGFASGTIYSDSELQSASVKGKIVGGLGNESGSIAAFGSIQTIEIGGDVTSGKGKDSARLSADKLLETLIIGGNVKGSATQPVWITAGGLAGSKVAALGSVSIAGNVEYANIVAGLGTSGTVGDNPDASIREIFVGKNWKASNAVAGLAPGADNFYGTSDDAFAPGTNDAGLVARIGKLTITGKIMASAPKNDRFGIVAERIDQVSIAGAKLKLLPGANNDNVIPPGATDLAVRELLLFV